jgi:glyoxylase-like metal-dependent hydrolase (beta-lactamase superfamily II)
MASIACGDFEITHVCAAHYRWDGGVFFGVVPKTMWVKKAPADELNRIRVAVNCYVVQTGDHSVLIETGIGDKPDPRARERMVLPEVHDPLPAILARQGIDPEQIDVVINSHLHFDHCGGNTRLTSTGPVPEFPRARYFASRTEWEHAHTRHPRDAISYLDENYDPLVESGRMTLVSGDTEIVPGIHMRHAPGHNRDMMVVSAESGGRTFCFLSDLVPTIFHVQPTWIAAVDLYPLLAIDKKIEWLTAAQQGNWICAFAHDPDVAFARIVLDEKTRFRGEPECA